jgi:hypothetical protein
MAAELTVGSLTSCEVSNDGQQIRLAAQDATGAPINLCLSHDQAGSLAMTLPRLLSAALKARYRDPALKFVFPLKDYQLEGTPGRKDLILSLRTSDGFEVSFAVTPATLSKLSELASIHEAPGALLAPLH